MLVQKALIVSDQAVSLTLSLGIAEYRVDTGGTLDALLALADQALYASKHALCLEASGARSLHHLSRLAACLIDSNPCPYDIG